MKAQTVRMALLPTEQSKPDAQTPCHQLRLSLGVRSGQGSPSSQAITLSFLLPLPFPSPPPSSPRTPRGHFYFSLTPHIWKSINSSQFYALHFSLISLFLPTHTLTALGRFHIIFTLKFLLLHSTPIPNPSTLGSLPTAAGGVFLNH